MTDRKQCFSYGPFLRIDQDMHLFLSHTHTNTHNNTSMKKVCIKSYKKFHVRSLTSFKEGQCIVITTMKKI